jgi:hypothetical protein
MDEALLGPRGKPKPDAVIGAQRIAAGKDQASGVWLCHSESFCFERVRLHRPRKNSPEQCEASGHDLSRAAKTPKQMWLQPPREGLRLKHLPSGAKARFVFHS